MYDRLITDVNDMFHLHPSAQYLLSMLFFQLHSIAYCAVLVICFMLTLLQSRVVN